METIQNKIDFAVVFRVTKANPNGDPLNGNRPRIDYEGYGEVTDVCIKRKIRDRLLERWVEDGKKEDDGNMIFVQSDDRKEDNAKSLKDRAEIAFKKLEEKFGSDKTVELSCKRWFDVRAFGQLFAYKEDKAKGKKATGEGISIGIRGPVSIHSAFSVEPVGQFVTSTQIAKSVSGEGDGKKRSSDTMGMKHRVDRGVYKFYGSINPQLAKKTGFSSEDADRLKQVLPRLFENDASSARPEGSMEVLKVIWWNHNSKAVQYPSSKVHRTLTVKPDGEIKLDKLDGLEPEEIDGF